MRKDRADVASGVHVNPSNADVATLHPRRVVDNQLRRRLLEMHGRDAAPLGIEVFDHQPSMAAVGRSLAAEECGGGF